MGLAARLVVFTLVGMGIWSLVAGVERLIALRKSNRASKQFARSASELVLEGDFEAVLSLTERHGVSPLAQLYRFGLQSYLDNIDDKLLGPVELATRQLSRKLEDLSAQLKRGTGILATTGSTAPFVGLFGTVIGIITVFTQIRSVVELIYDVAVLLVLTPTYVCGSIACLSGVSFLLASGAVNCVATLKGLWLQPHCNANYELCHHADDATHH